MTSTNHHGVIDTSSVKSIISEGMLPDGAIFTHTTSNMIPDDNVMDNNSIDPSELEDVAFESCIGDIENRHSLPTVEEYRSMSSSMSKKDKRRANKKKKEDDDPTLTSDEVRRISELILQRVDKAVYLERKRNFLESNTRKIMIITLPIFLGVVFILAMLLFVGFSKPNHVLDNNLDRDNTIYHRASRFDEVVDYLSTHSNSNDLNTPGIPQNLAARWIADTDELNVPINETTKFLQRYALAVLYFAMGGPTFWTSQLGFLSTEDECSWFELGVEDGVKDELEIGASCLGSTLVRQLVFASNMNLRGTFPRELALLSNLEHISISGNSGVTGPLPKFFTKMTNLDYLKLDSCAFEGTLASWIGNLTSLTKLHLSNNHIIGYLPSELKKLTKLRSLSLANNNLIGSIEVFESLPQLEVLIAKDNFLHGQIDITFLQRLSKLEVLDLSKNRIASTLPTNLFHQKNLRIVDVHSNVITGTIPNVFSDHLNFTGKLEYLSLKDNELVGAVPSSLSKLTALDHLDLSKNRLTSTLPNELGLLTNLQYLLLDMNHFAEQDESPTLFDKLENLKVYEFP